MNNTESLTVDQLRFRAPHVRIILLPYNYGLDNKAILCYHPA